MANAATANKPSPYVRPEDWLNLPDITTEEQVAYILAAVFPHDSNFAAISCKEDYQIDWGDGASGDCN